ncbi:hypothetical protein AAG906_003123 [Vitis piasezkii]
MASINDNEEEESESESDEDSIEEECTNEDANMCFMALEEHQDEEPIDRKLNRSRSGSTLNSTGRGPGRPTPQLVEARVDPQLNRLRVHKTLSLSSRMVVQPIKVEPQPVEVRLRSG